MVGHAEVVVSGLDHELDRDQYEFWEHLYNRLDAALRRCVKPD